jgi:hypothetical protein
MVQCVEISLGRDDYATVCPTKEEATEAGKVSQAAAVTTITTTTNTITTLAVVEPTGCSKWDKDYTMYSCASLPTCCPGYEGKGMSPTSVQCIDIALGRAYATICDETATEAGKISQVADVTTITTTEATEAAKISQAAAVTTISTTTAITATRAVVEPTACSKWDSDYTMYSCASLPTCCPGYEGKGMSPTTIQCVEISLGRAYNTICD